MKKWYFDKRLWLGVAVSGFFFYLLLVQVDVRKVAAAFLQINPLYLLPAIMATLASYYVRAMRWKVLVAPIKVIALPSLFAATMIGYMANNVLPARLGELVRAYALGKKEQVPTSAVLGTLVVDRLLDGLTALIILTITLISIDLPPGKEQIEEKLLLGGYVISAGYLLVLAVLLVVKNWPQWSIRLSEKLFRHFIPKYSQRIVSWISSFLDGLVIWGSFRRIFYLLISSLLLWSLAIWPIDLVLRSFGLVLPVSATLFIMVLLVVAVMIPAAPGYVGTYHYACYEALSAYNVPPDKALSIAIVIHAVGFVPVMLAGLFFLWKEKYSLGTGPAMNGEGQGE